MENNFCHSTKDVELERMLKEFDEFYTLPRMMIPGPQRENAIKKFITQVYTQAKEEERKRVKEIMKEYEGEDSSLEDRGRYGWKAIKKHLNSVGENKGEV